MYYVYIHIYIYIHTYTRVVRESVANPRKSDSARRGSRGSGTIISNAPKDNGIRATGSKNPRAY